MITSKVLAALTLQHTMPVPTPRINIHVLLHASTLSQTQRALWPNRRTAAKPRVWPTSAFATVKPTLNLGSTARSQFPAMWWPKVLGGRTQQALVLWAQARSRSSYGFGNVSSPLSPSCPSSVIFTESSRDSLVLDPGTATGLQHLQGIFGLRPSREGEKGEAQMLGNV